LSALSTVAIGKLTIDEGWDEKQPYDHPYNGERYPNRLGRKAEARVSKICHVDPSLREADACALTDQIQPVHSDMD
jgi:hypothetical protein